MKITHICLCGPVTDGWTYQDNLLPKYHKEIGYETSVITSQFVYGENNELKIDSHTNYQNEYGIQTFRLKSKYNTTVYSKFKIYCNLYETINKENPDILFVHGVQFLNIVEVVKYLKKHPEVSAYVDNHADFSNSAANWLSKTMLHKFIWKKCAQLIEPYVTEFYGVLPARVDFLKNVYKLPEHKIDLLVMGADDEEVAKAKEKNVIDQIRTKYNIEQHDFLIITGGKIDKAKKQTLLLMEAVRELEKENVKLIVFGSVIEELWDDVQRLTDGEKVQFIGWIQGHESYKYFAAADLGVFPGRHSVLWEQAVGTGLPCIFRYWRGTTHLNIGGNCKFLYNDSADEIKKSIRDLLHNKEKYNYMKHNSEEYGKVFFSYNQIAKKSIRDY